MECIGRGRNDNCEFSVRFKLVNEDDRQIEFSRYIERNNTFIAMGEQQYIRNYPHSWWLPRPWITLMSVSLFVNLAYTSITCGPEIKSTRVSSGSP